MSNDIYITSSCTISNNVVSKNGRSLFDQQQISLPDFLIAAYHHFGISYPKFYKMDAVSKLGLLATEILLKDDFAIDNYKAEDIGIVLSNANSSLDTDVKYFDTVKEMASPALFVYTLPNIVIGEISIKHKLKGENAFFINEKFDVAFIQQYVSLLFNNNIVQACICGWVEALGEEYKTVLFLVEKTTKNTAVLLRQTISIKFTINKMDKLIADLKVQIIDQLNLQDIKPEDIGDDQPLFVEGLGLDSIDALELIVLLQQHYKIKLSNAQDGPKVFKSVRTMAEYITEHQPKTI